MTDSLPIAVLKFGSSVLASEDSLESVVSEIYRFRRRGYAVVAVVSAIGETTDELVEAVQARYGSADETAFAALLATGEQRSVAWLELALTEAGLPARSFDARSCGLVGYGPRLEADPVGVDKARIVDALDQGYVAVIPGFVGIDLAGAPLLFGRGGSDCSAVFLADRLGADVCRLLKDTEGVFEFDPRRPGRAPRRFESLSVTDAMKLDGGVLQDRALKIAADRERPFDVAAPGSPWKTAVGVRAQSRLTSHDHAAPTRVLLAGCGHVGSALADRILRTPGLELVGILVRDLVKKRPVSAATELFTNDPRAFMDTPAEILVETIGDLETSAELWRLAKERGISLVSANKNLLARRILKEAEAGTWTSPDRFGAAVGGALPLLEILDTARSKGRRIRRIRGILNGTSNFFCDEAPRAVDRKTLLEEARRRGLAEADPTRDLDGRDAEDKLIVVADRLGLRILESRRSAILDAKAFEDIQNAAHRGESLRQIATLEVIDGPSGPGNGARTTVDLVAIDSEGFLGSARGAENRVIIEFEAGSPLLLRGLGAGARPTVEALIGDLGDLRRRQLESIADFKRELSA